MTTLISIPPVQDRDLLLSIRRGRENANACRVLRSRPFQSAIKPRLPGLVPIECNPAAASTADPALQSRAPASAPPCTWPRRRHPLQPHIRTLYERLLPEAKQDAAWVPPCVTGAIGVRVLKHQKPYQADWTQAIALLCSRWVGVPRGGSTDSIIERSADFTLTNAIRGAVVAQHIQGYPRISAKFSASDHDASTGIFAKLHIKTQCS